MLNETEIRKRFKSYQPLFGNYRFNRLIGIGGFGAVYEVTDGTQYKAIKLIETSLEDFDTKLNEVKFMYRVSHCENIVKIYDHTDKIIQDDDKNIIGRDILILMDILTCVKNIPNMPEEEIIKCGIDCCNGLIYLGKTMHRDIKPDNIYKTASGVYQLGDLGLAKITDENSYLLSNAGTMPYQSPELIMGEGYTYSSDIYSLGMSLYQLSNGGVLPFMEDIRNTTRNANKAMKFRVIDKEKLPNPKNASPDLVEIILKACAYETKDRYQNAKEFKDSLTKLLSCNNCVDKFHAETDEFSTKPSGAFINPEELSTKPSEAFPNSEELLTKPSGAFPNSEELLTKPSGAFVNPEELSIKSSGVFVNPEELSIKSSGVFVNPDELHSKSSVVSKLSEVPKSDMSLSKFAQEVNQIIDEMSAKDETDIARKYYDLGIYCYEGKYIEKDLKQAIYWWTKSAEQGYADAQCCLGDCYYKGEGVEQDYKQAVKWYIKSAKQGNMYAQNGLGICYENGFGINKDKDFAIYLYTKSAEQGYAEAQNNLGNYYISLSSIKNSSKNYEQAVYWYTKSAEQGNMYAQYNLGVCYQNGLGVNKDEEKAVYWYKKSAEQGYAEAQCSLGERYRNGDGVVRNIQQAVYWYKKSAEQDNVNAQYKLGHLYNVGYGVEQDYIQAIYWWEKSAKQGKGEAIIAIENLLKEGLPFSQKRKLAKEALNRLKGNS